MRALISLLALAWIAGCPSEPPPSGDEDAGSPADDAGPDADAGPEPDNLRTTLDDEDDYAELRGAAGSVKFLLQLDDVEPVAPILERCMFQNTLAYEYHLPFINDLPGGDEVSYDDYVAYVITRATRVWWGGQVIWLGTTAHPISEEDGVLAYGIYTRDSVGDRLEADDIREVDAILKSCTPYYEGKLAFSPQTTEQVQTATIHRAALQAEGIAVLMP
jgi:hypothetical protein